MVDSIRIGQEYFINDRVDLDSCCCLMSYYQDLSKNIGGTTTMRFIIDTSFLMKEQLSECLTTHLKPEKISGIIFLSLRINGRPINDNQHFTKSSFFVRLFINLIC